MFYSFFEGEVVGEVKMKIFQKDELKILLPFYLETFISCLFFFVPAFWILQFQQNLSLTQIGILFSVLSISVFFFEIPTGAFADIYGRKYSSLLGYFLMAILQCSLFFFHNFYSVLLIFILWGLFMTFISGAKEAWIIDKLKYNKKKHLIKEYYLKNQSILRFSLFLSGLLGALLVAKFGLNIIWLFGGFSFLVSGIMLCFIAEQKISRDKKQSFKLIFNQAKKSIKFSLRHKVLFLILMATFFIMFRDSLSTDLVWQPFLKNLHFPIYAFGLLFSGITLLGTFIPFLVKPLLSKFESEKNYIAFLLFVAIILNLLALLVNNFIFGLIVFALIMLVIDLSLPIESTYFQKFVPGKMRATILSFNSMVISLAYAISSVITGVLADKIGPQYTIVIGAVFLIPAFVLYLKIKEKKKIK
jgi:MFS family permease